MSGMTAVLAAASQPSPDLAELIALFRRHGNLTRAEVIALTGLGRSTVNQRMDTLVEAGLLRPAGAAHSTGGRPPSRFAFHAAARQLLVAHIGASGLRAALCDLAGGIVAERSSKIDVATGSQAVLGTVDRFFDDLLASQRSPKPPLAGIGVSVPGPVEFATGRVVSPPIMTGWDGYDIPQHFKRLAVPVLVDNDVNAMALGEQRTHYPQTRHLLMVKVSTGVGAGIIHGGRVMRGAQGCAGDIGHMPVNVPGVTIEPTCRCGKVGCAEAYAGGWALIRDMQQQRQDVSTPSELVALIRGGDRLATKLARRASQVLGEIIGDAVNLLNPSQLIIGGTLARADELLLAGIRQAIYTRCTPLATKSLHISTSRLDSYAGITGLALMCADTALSVAEPMLS